MPKLRRRASRAELPEPASLVLVVDDYADNREMYAEYLRFAGYRVELAADGATALAKVRALAPAVVVMDLELPVLDGWRATRAIKEDPATAHVCVVVVTGHAMPEPVRLARSAGANLVLTKPILPSALVDVIRGCCPSSSTATGRRRKVTRAP